MSSKSSIAALFVEKHGAYFGLDFVDPWDIDRDARRYGGPSAVIAHPPCERWGRYWSGGPSAKVKRLKGDDQGCFAAALHAVELYGGILEHPEASHAFAYYSITRPPKTGGWIPTRLGFACCVEQGHYGHPARKATWLYYNGRGIVPSDLIWGPCTGKKRLDQGFHSKEERAEAGEPALHRRITARECAATPLLFRDLLVSLVQGIHNGK